MYRSARGGGQASRPNTSWTSPVEETRRDQVDGRSVPSLSSRSVSSSNTSLTEKSTSSGRPRQMAAHVGAFSPASTSSPSSSPSASDPSSLANTIVTDAAPTTATNNTQTPTSNHAKHVSLASSTWCRTSYCWLWKGLLNPRGILMWPFSLQVLLLALCYCRHVSSDDQLNLIHARLINMLKTKQSLLYRRQLRSEATLDLRNHRVFHSDMKTDCCPTLTEFQPRRTAINQGGLVLELFSNPNSTQSFYETICHPSFRNRPCQFIDPRISYATRCVQQYSYVYAVARTYGSDEMFRIDFIRIPAGCKCQVKKGLLRRRKKRVMQ